MKTRRGLIKINSGTPYSLKNESPYTHYIRLKFFFSL